MARLDDLLAAYPWLGRLGTDLLGRLDLAELADPHPCALALGPTVVAYRRGARPSVRRISLCAVLPTARIGAARIAVLNDAERAHPGICLVEYAADLLASDGAASHAVPALHGSELMAQLDPDLDRVPAQRSTVARVSLLLADERLCLDHYLVTEQS